MDRELDRAGVCVGRYFGSLIRLHGIVNMRGRPQTAMSSRAVLEDIVNSISANNLNGLSVTDKQ